MISGRMTGKGDKPMTRPIKHDPRAIARKRAIASNREAMRMRALVRKPPSRWLYVELALAAAIGATCGVILAAIGV